MKEWESRSPMDAGRPRLTPLPRRLARNMGSLTLRQQRTLHARTAVVVGLGGVGGLCAELLTRAGVGRLIVVDGDKFDETNLNRQLYATHNTLGMYKTEVAGTRLASISRDVEVVAFHKRLRMEEMETEQNLLWSDIIIDCMDHLPSRVALARVCKKKRIPYVYAAASGHRGMVSVFDRPADLEEALNLPTRGKPITECEAALIHYPQCRTAWGPATNLVGALAANAALNRMLRKPYPKSPKFWMVDAFSAQIVREDEL